MAVFWYVVPCFVASWGGAVPVRWIILELFSDVCMSTMTPSNVFKEVQVSPESLC